MLKRRFDAPKSQMCSRTVRVALALLASDFEAGWVLLPLRQESETSLADDDKPGRMRCWPRVKTFPPVTSKAQNSLSPSDKIRPQDMTAIPAA